MAVCPFAVQQPIESRYIGRIPMAAYNRVNVHITAGLGNPWGYFNGPGKASSHFFIALNGTVFQYQDTAYRAEGDLDGNDATISIEHEGRVGPMTTAQREASIRLSAWLWETHGFKTKIAADSKIGLSSHGLSWHRIGVDGNFPALPSPLAGRLQRGGGMHYSKAFGKTCPTDPIILDDIPAIAAVVFGGTVTWPDVPPVVVPPPAPVRLNPYGRPLLREDGRLGPLTITEWQMQEGTYPDGYINGQTTYNGRFYNRAWSSLVYAAQGTFGTKRDGVISYPRSSLVGAMQRFLGLPNPDSYISWPVSTTVALLQKALNTGRYPR